MRICTLVLGLVLSCLQVSVVMAAELTQTLKRINDSGEINLGHRKSEPPMSFVDESGKAAGYSIDLCEVVVAAVMKKLERTNIKINYVPVTAASRFEAIESSKVDLLCGATTKTLGRSEKVGFSQLTFVTGGGLLSRSDAAISNITGLKGKKVAVVEETTTRASLERVLSENAIDSEIITVASLDEGMALLEKGEVAAFSSDQVVLIGSVISRSAPDQYFLSPQLFSYEPFALAMQRGDADFQLVVDSALSQVNRSGQIVGIYGKWFGKFGMKPPVALQMLYQLGATPE
ncbi:MAG: amino acid ABC transporter substrate-binding protein [Porticoccus sp.]